MLKRVPNLFGEGDPATLHSVQHEIGKTTVIHMNTNNKNNHINDKTEDAIGKSYRHETKNVNKRKSRQRKDNSSGANRNNTEDAT